MPTFDELVTHIDQPGIDSNPQLDITLLKPDISQVEALAVQIAVKKRHAAAGDRIVGHQASFTSSSVQRIFPTAPVPMVGTLLRSLIRNSAEAVPLDTPDVAIECEIGVVLGRDLDGPDLTRTEIAAAVEAYLPAIEVAPVRSGVREGKYSWPHMIAVQKAKGGFVVLGNQLTTPKNFDARLEGCLVSINGEPKAGATGFESMGDPLTAVAAIARKLHEVGEKLHRGQVVITGSVTPPQFLGPASFEASADFQTLGRVSVRFQRSE